MPLPPLVDTHCHLDLAAFDEDREAVVARAVAAGVTDLVVPAIRPAAWAKLAGLPARLPALRVHVALGIHPQVVPELPPEERARVELLAEACAAAGAVAIGECGLDGGTGAREEQERLLRRQIGVARELGRPLLLHVLGAHGAAPRLLAEERAHEVGGIVHSYSGGAELVAVYRDLGFAFSFSGAVTWPGARRPVEAARAVPVELLLVETDAPDQAPALHRGGRSEPAHLPDVVRGLARARGEDEAAVAAATTANARRVLRLG